MGNTTLTETSGFLDAVIDNSIRERTRSERLQRQAQKGYDPSLTPLTIPVPVEELERFRNRVSYILAEPALCGSSPPNLYLVRTRPGEAYATKLFTPDSDINATMENVRQTQSGDILFAFFYSRDTDVVDARNQLKTLAAKGPAHR